MGLFDDERLTRLTISVTQTQRRELGELAALDQGLYAVSKAVRQEAVHRLLTVNALRNEVFHTRPPTEIQAGLKALKRALDNLEADDAEGRCETWR